MRYLALSIFTVFVISTIPFVLPYELTDADFTVPSWIKNNAGWWADDLIGDDSFVSGIEWLVTNDVFVLPAIEQGTSDGENVVPSWIKSTAGWWAEDKINDVTFVSAIKYLINEGIMVVQQVEEAEESVEETVEMKEFYMEVNGNNCCLNWAYVGDEYYLQIETYDEQHGKYIDGVEISAKIISKGGELRYDFGEVTTEDGFYKNSIIIPNMDWYAGNILSVTGEYYGVEKTIEKEFEVFRNNSGSSGSSGSENSGKKMFVLGTIGDDVNEYTLATAFNATSATFVDSFIISSQEDDASGVAFSNSGKKMFIVGSDSDNVNEYTLTTAWDVSSASFVDSFSVASQENKPHGIAFSNSGKKMFIVGIAGDDVNEYTLSTAWDVSEASFVDSFSVASEEVNPSGIAFSNSGKKMFIVGTADDDVNEYTLGTSFDVSSASFVDSFSVADQDTSPQDIEFSNSGKTMFILGNAGNDINQYKLSTSFDISTASFADSFSVAGQDTTVLGFSLG